MAFWRRSATWRRWHITRLVCWAMNQGCAPWANGRGRQHRQNIAPAELFRFTKIFTERCWSNRRSRHEFFRIRKNWQAQPDQGASAFAIFDHHLGGIAVENFQALGNVRHADAAASKAVGWLQQLGGAHADAIVLDFHNEARLDQTATQGDAAALDLGC